MAVGAEKAALARLLIDELDSPVDPDAEQLWAEEAQRWYAADQRGGVSAKSGDEVMSRAGNRLKSA
jgi:hypothetical protein